MAWNSAFYHISASSWPILTFQKPKSIKIKFWIASAPFQASKCNISTLKSKPKCKILEIWAKKWKNAIVPKWRLGSLGFFPHFLPLGGLLLQPKFFGNRYGGSAPKCNAYFWATGPSRAKTETKNSPKNLFTALALPFSNILIHNIAKKLPSDPTWAIDVKKNFFSPFFPNLQTRPYLRP